MDDERDVYGGLFSGDSEEEEENSAGSVLWIPFELYYFAIFLRMRIKITQLPEQQQTTPDLRARVRVEISKPKI